MRAARPALLLFAAVVSLSFAISSRPAQVAPDIIARVPAASGAERWEEKYDSLRTDFGDYIWPTDAGRNITSTFGEFRRTHFHAGLDVGTGDRTGYKAFASRDGYVARIGVSADGYGKVLYVRHADGYTTVYAHLDRFMKSLEARVRREQEILERYPVDIACAPREFPVSKGDVIAYTGETGAGSPHLHFEIRDEHMNAVNPLLCPGFEVADDMSPGANALALIPIGPGSFVDGRNHPSVRRLSPDQGGVMVARSQFRLSGDAGVAINIRDRSNGSWYRHGAYGHTLRIDDSVVFDVRLDRIPVDEGQQIALYYSWPLLRAGKGRYEKLFVDESNELPFVSNTELGAGTISSFLLAPGLHSLSVRSVDFHGNTTVTVGEVLVEPQPDYGLPDWRNPGGTNGDAAYSIGVDASIAGGFVHVLAEAPAPFTTRPVLSLREGPVLSSFTMNMASRSTAVATFSPAPAHQGARTVAVNADVAGAPARGERDVTVFVIEPGRSGSFAIDDGKLSVWFDEGATFGQLALLVQRIDREEESFYRFTPEDAVLRDGITVVVQPDRLKPKQGLYVSSRGRWRLIQTEKLPDGSLHGRMRRTLSDLAVFADATPPIIGLLRLQQRPGRRLYASFGFDDNLSGVDYESMKLYLDGQFCVPEIDGEHERAVFLSAEPLSVGPHRLMVTLSDEMGNTTSVEKTIVIR